MENITRIAHASLLRTGLDFFGLQIDTLYGYRILKYREKEAMHFSK